MSRIKTVKVNCKHCGKSVFKEKRRFKENKKIGHNFYCSRNCQGLKFSKTKTFICENCGKKFLRSPHAISPHNYCSRSCAAIMNNKKSPKRNGKVTVCKNCNKSFNWQIGNKKYCSMKCRRLCEKWTPGEIINLISKTAQRLGRTPSRRELNKINNASRRVFGSWNKAVAATNLFPNRSHNNRMYKRAITKALDGHYCDSISELIIDNWLYKNKIWHERNASYPSTNHKADWRVKRKDNLIFIEYFGLAKDSPRYDRSIKKKESLCKEHKIKLIEIYPWDLYPKVKLKNKLNFLLN